MLGLTFTTDEVKKLPSKPGIYKFISHKNELIYVGKAKDLKKRVSSYFQRNVHTGRKTRKLIEETSRIDITIVNSEFDAFLLENTLIKENQPKYNILLKDDKTFPYICVTNERFSRVISTRKKYPDSGKYFGPYASVRAMNNVLDLIRNLYHIRTCKLALSEQNIEKGKFKVCLEYHIGKCLGPCEALQTEENYNHEVEQVINILKGDLKPVRQYFARRMTEYAEKLEFEKAEFEKQRILLLDKFQSRSVVVNPNVTNIDVFSVVSDEKKAYINYLKIQSGAIHHTYNIEVTKKLEETNQEILSLWIIELRNKFDSQADEILVNTEINEDIGVRLILPKRGDKRKLVELSLKNALYFKKEKSETKPVKKSADQFVLNRLKDDLQLKSVPLHIECFDNSNIQGYNPVASMVCFRNGKPFKKDYRKFNVRTVQGPDDFASMREIIYRRYYRLIKENLSLPDLIVIDGGKGQLNAAISSLKKLDLYGAIPVVGIAKKLEEIYFPEDEIPLYIDKKSPSLKLLQQIRNEAHRFAITFHRQKRSSASLQSKLDTIEGIGDKTKNKLLLQYKSLKKISETDSEEIIKLIGKGRANILFDALKKNRG